MAIVTAPAAQLGTPATVMSATTDWREALIALVQWLVANDRCFSSGECAAYLRKYRPDLQFAQNTLGEYLRRWFDNDPNPQYPVPPAFPEYDDGQGGTLYPTQVARTTSGVARTLDGRTVVSRTPVGFTVFVYAKDNSAGYAHDFEVLVPDPRDPRGLNIVDYTGQPIAAPVTVSTPSATPGAAPVVTAKPTPAQGNLILGKLSAADLTAYVPKDSSGATSPRVVIPRPAFEAWVNLSGMPIRGGQNGDPVYVTLDGRKIVVTRGPTATSSEYKLWNNRGRIAIVAPGIAIGDKFRVTVTANELTVDLDDKV